MATTRLMPLHTGKGRTVAEALGRTTDYVNILRKRTAVNWCRLTNAIRLL